MSTTEWLVVGSGLISAVIGKINERLLTHGNGKRKAKAKGSLMAKQYIDSGKRSLQWIALQVGIHVISQLALVRSHCVADDGLEFFEKKIRPILVEHCYKCHSADSKELRGDLRLDLKEGWKTGGESGAPAILPGNPDSSPLMRAMRHDDDVSAMPPDKPRLQTSVINDFSVWIQMGAPDPRDGKLEHRDKADQWETAFQKRLDWWSLKPVQFASPPRVQHVEWVRTDVDRFILAELEAAGLSPVLEADHRTLARRLSFALTGLPPERIMLADFEANTSPLAYDDLVTKLLDSPHFGERWARHWMDVVHYSDTHGYEWDVPVKNAWRYRDYLIRAFNSDISFPQFVTEQIAGDLLEPRIDTATGLNEALTGPMMLRLGERRHGDNAAAEGVMQEAVSNMVDTLGKAFLGTTLACAQCHDHKLDAVEQRDYYSLAGMLMSTRFSARPVDAVDPNEAVINELRVTKALLRTELARVWYEATDVKKPAGFVEKIRAITADQNPNGNFPSTLSEFWKRSLSSPVTADEFAKECQSRVAANQANLTLLVDFSKNEAKGDWRSEGFGMKHGLTTSGEIVVADEGDCALMHVLPAGRFSHVWSQRLAGSLQSPQLDPTSPITFSVELASGKFASLSFIVDRALNPERLQFPKRPVLGWQTLIAGKFDSLEGSIDSAPRRVYLELATKSLNNYFPPRVGYGGVSEAEVADPRSWFGVTRIYQHAPGKVPQDELTRFQPLFDRLLPDSDWALHLTTLLRGCVQRWSAAECTDEDVRLLNDALQLNLLPNGLDVSTEVATFVGKYRSIEKKLQPDRTVGSAADWNEGSNERIGIRGSYTEQGDSVERGLVRFLGPTVDRQNPLVSGRLDWARQVTDDRNPLIARVYVNRVWHYLFGEGLVRTPDDFGHLGQAPSHPELLDYLATRFVQEGWSTKKLIRMLVTSSVWRQASVPAHNAIEVDPENRLWHHLPMRRLEAEPIRDSILMVAGRLDRTMFGPPIEPFRTAEDSQKRLFQGPLDGEGRRSIYLDMTLMEPPRFLALFNQPIPKQTVGRRDVSNVPDQALALLNDPFVIAMAKHWSERLVADGLTSPEHRIAGMLETALARPARPSEIAGLLQLIHRSVELQEETCELLTCQGAWQNAAHAVFNLKEFLYVR